MTLDDLLKRYEESRDALLARWSARIEENAKRGSGFIIRFIYHTLVPENLRQVTPDNLLYTNDVLLVHPYAPSCFALVQSDSPEERMLGQVILDANIYVVARDYSLNAVMLYKLSNGEFDPREVEQ